MKSKVVARRASAFSARSVAAIQLGAVGVEDEYHARRRQAISGREALRVRGEQAHVAGLQPLPHAGLRRSFDARVEEVTHVELEIAADVPNDRQRPDKSHGARAHAVRSELHWRRGGGSPTEESRLWSEPFDE